MNLHNAKFVKSAVRPSDFIRSGLPQIVFAGKSNVGKSSVINKLLNRKNFARVGAAPGKTVHINYFLIDEKAYFVDLPGYGYAKVAKSEKHRWSELIEGYFAQDRNLQLVMQLVDMRHPASALDVQMVEFLIAHELPFIVLLTKSDKLNQTKRKERLARIREELPCGDQLTIIPFSGETGEGVDEVHAIIEEIAAAEETDD